MTCCFFFFFRSSFRPLAMATYLDPRVSSNKENSPPSSIALNDIDAISLSLRTSLSGVTPPPKKKIVALGLGRAPKFTYRRHSNKPYNRSTSITRAKKAAVKSKSVRPKAAIKKSKTRPPPLKLVQGPDVESAKLARLERLRRAVWHPPAPVPGQVKVPLKLPYPRFPSFEYIDNEYHIFSPFNTSSTACFLFFPPLLPLPLPTDLMLPFLTPTPKSCLVPLSPLPFQRLSTVANLIGLPKHEDESPIWHLLSFANL